MERPSDGGIYRAGRGLNSSNFEFPGYCVLRARTSRGRASTATRR